jgi:hypothetical protein
MAKRPWLESTHSFAFNIGDRTPGESVNAIGWAVLEYSAPRVLRSGESPAKNDPVAEAMKLWIAQGRPSPVVIYRYDAATFPNSVPAMEGTTLDEHIALTKALKAALEDEGAEVDFRWALPLKR